MIITDLFSSRDACHVCGQTPCNCTHIAEEKVRLDPKCWKGKKIGNPKTKMKGGVRVNNCEPAESVNEGQVKDIAIQYQDYKHLPEMAFQSPAPASSCWEWRIYWNCQQVSVRGSQTLHAALCC